MPQNFYKLVVLYEVVPEVSEKHKRWVETRTVVFAFQKLGYWFFQIGDPILAPKDLDRRIDSTPSNMGIFLLKQVE